MCTVCQTQRPKCRLTKLIDAISYSSSSVWHLIMHTYAHLQSLNADEGFLFLLFFSFFCEPNLSRRPAKPIVWLPNTLAHKHKRAFIYIQTRSLSLANAVCINATLNANASHFHLSKNSLFGGKNKTKQQLSVGGQRCDCQVKDQ